MEHARKTYIFYEIGDSCRTEFLMTDEDFHSTEDAVVLGFAEGPDPAVAFKILKKENPGLQEYKTASIVAREIGPPFYL